MYAIFIKETECNVHLLPIWAYNNMVTHVTHLEPSILVS